MLDLNTEFSDAAYPKLVQLSRDVAGAVEEVCAAREVLAETAGKLRDHNTDPLAHENRLAEIDQKVDAALASFGQRLEVSVESRLVAATAEKLGLVRPDNVTIMADQEGVLSLNAEKAAEFAVKPDNVTIEKDDDNILSVKSSVEPLPDSIVMRDSDGNVRGNITGYAVWADLAEIYHSASPLTPGDVVAVNESGDADIRLARPGDIVLGIVSRRPGLLLNSAEKDLPLRYPVARVGMVLARVRGPVEKGQRLGLAGEGFAKALSSKSGGFAWALETVNGEGESLVKCLL